MTKIHTSTTDTHLFVIGDSFTAGVGLNDPLQSYPHVLSDLVGCPVTNDGFPGASHDRILRRSMSFVSEWIIHKRGPLFVIAGWGYRDRMEFYQCTDPNSPEEDENYLRYTGLSPRHEPYYERRNALEFARIYQQNFTNRQAATTRALTRVLGLQSFLKTMGVPFLFFNSVWTLPVDNNPMAAFVDRNRYYGFQDKDKTFNRWTRQNGFTGRTELGHPDAVAHTMWASHLSDVINNGNLWS